MKNPWTQFEHHAYHLQNLGRPAIFLIPVRKTYGTIKHELREFLLAHFGAFTTTLIPQFGLWLNVNNKAVVVCDECFQYEVSFVGKEDIPFLLEKLAAIARRVEEDCIYFKAGEDACLIYPR